MIYKYLQEVLICFCSVHAHHMLTTALVERCLLHITIEQTVGIVLIAYCCIWSSGLPLTLFYLQLDFGRGFFSSFIFSFSFHHSSFFLKKFF